MLKSFKLLKKKSSGKSPTSFAEILKVGNINKNNMKHEFHYTDFKLKQFNCYKHNFTNYKDLIDLMNYGDYNLKQGVAILQHIYKQLLNCGIPKHLKESVLLAFRYSLAKYKKLIVESRLTEEQSMLNL